jgi:hypothetical protein
MIKKVKMGCLIGMVLIGSICRDQKTIAQPIREDGISSYAPVISRIAVLSIHVRDTMVHDSVFHFLTDKLGLSVEYYPVIWAGRKYAGVYAGNMYLEPCGPFSNFSYASKNFKAIFFGVNCESERSLISIREDLGNRKIAIEQTETIQITDSAFIRQNIYFSISSNKLSERKTEDSLRTVMLRNNSNSLGIERIKEIRIGYAGESALVKWQELLNPAVETLEGLWNISEDQSIRLVKSAINEVNGIVFQVESLRKAKSWLIENNLLGNTRKDEIELNPLKTFRLRILIQE